MPRTMTLIQEVNAALAHEMGREEKIVLLGEDVGGNGGGFRAPQGLFEAYGEERVIDTPLNESGIVGMAFGTALHGLHPVVEIQFADFIWPPFDQIPSEVTKFRYKSAGMFTLPMVIRTPFGGGTRGGHYHSQSIESHFAHTAGIGDVTLIAYGAMVPVCGRAAGGAADAGISAEVIDLRHALPILS
ncbi:MAG: transketolase C-terminal domain-containing protein [bacterium]